jgi:hypothetical protein
MRKALVSVLVVLALAIPAGIALASIPDSSGTIHGCYNTKDGTLRVIDSDAGRTCAKGETALNWNQTGPQGPAGAPGMSGYEQVTTVQRYSQQTLADLTANCPGGKRVVSGGWSIKVAPGAPADADYAYLSAPRRDAPNGDTGWRLIATVVPTESYNPETGGYDQYPVDLTVYATCATAS